MSFTLFCSGVFRRFSNVWEGQAAKTLGVLMKAYVKSKANDQVM